MTVPKQKILIVDDEPQNIKILGEALKLQHQIFIAVNGEAALGLAQNKQPDLILLDIMMPGMNGYDVLRELKANDKTSAIPVIFITARDTEEDETRGLEIGAVDYIVKPFSLPIVKARVKTHLELKRHRDTLEYYAMYDGLTGVLTRRRFDELLLSEWNRCIRTGLPISLIMIDIDHFKLYNDNYGHPAGDRCLKRVADTLNSVLKRSSDFLARYGGEEFVALLAGSDGAEAEEVAGLMRNAVQDLNVPHEYSPVSGTITISLGISVMTPNREIPASALVKTADEMLYEAKAAGRNGYRVSGNPPGNS